MAPWVALFPLPPEDTFLELHVIEALWRLPEDAIKPVWMEDVERDPLEGEYGRIAAELDGLRDTLQNDLRKRMKLAVIQEKTDSLPLTDAFLLLASSPVPLVTCGGALAITPSRNSSGTPAEPDGTPKLFPLSRQMITTSDD